MPRRPLHLRPLRLSLVLLCVLFSGTAAASDFWDAVRNPGLSTYRARLRAAAEALRDNRPAHALEAANSAVALIAGHPGAHVLRGRALAASRDYARAQVAFERALSLDETALDEWEAGAAAATTALQLGDLPRAANTLTRLLAAKREPAQQAALLALQADVLQAQGPQQLDRSRRTYRAALRGDRHEPAALLGLALCFHREGEVDEALHLAARLKAEPELTAGGRWALPESERLARRALWLQAIGDQAGARQAWRRAAASEGPWREHAQASARTLERTP